MKILYAIQGTGNGHLSRARDIIPALQKRGEVDILVSGTQADVDLPYPVKYRYRGLSFIFGKNGGVDMLETYKKSNVRKLYNEINSLPVDEYDIIINDFEPVSAWACKMKHKACIGLSHQSAVINKKSPKPKKYDVVGKAILKHYAPVDLQIGFHFSSYDKNIFTPVIRSEIRNAVAINKKHFTVYLPAYNDNRIIKILQEIKGVQWQVFSKHSKKQYQYKNIFINPVNNDAFIESFITGEGVLCGAGFETPAEALYLQKKLLVIPMKGQYEQQCNAAALSQIGVTVIKSLKLKHVKKIEEWIKSKNLIKVHYPDITDQIIAEVFRQYKSIDKAPVVLGEELYSAKKLKTLSLGKILSKIAE